MRGLARWWLIFPVGLMLVGIALLLSSVQQKTPEPNGSPESVGCRDSCAVNHEASYIRNEGYGGLTTSCYCVRANGGVYKAW